MLIGDDGTGNYTVRAAIEEANATVGFKLINFNILGAGPHTILLTSDLPAITEKALIDVYSQPGAAPNDNPIGLPNNVVIRIEISRVGAAVSNLGDLHIGRSFDGEHDNLISGINGAAIHLRPDATGVYIWGNAIGVAANLTDPLGNLGAAVLI